VETREYDGDFQGVPLLKSCLTIITVSDAKETRTTTTPKQFEKIERTPAPEHVFTEQSLGVGKIKIDGLPTQPYRRMDRHWRLILMWFGGSVLLIAVARFRDSVRRCFEDQQIAPYNNEPPSPKISDRL
jgi:hypothetical protein